MHRSLDTFTHYIADNLKDASVVAIPVHQMRYDVNRPDAAAMQMNAVNIQIGNPVFDVSASSLDIHINVINDNELVALDWMEQLQRLLNAAACTPKLDYTVPASPVAVGGWIYWATKVTFRPITNSGYSHFFCTVTLHHHFS
jgi:hypothetical protein